MATEVTPKLDTELEARWVVPSVVAISLLLAVMVFDIWLLTHLDHNDTMWHRAMAVYKGLEALALTGAGFLFGREVNRSRAERAESRARDAETRAHVEHGESQKHKAILNSLIDLLETKSDQSVAVTDGGQSGQNSSEWTQLARYAAKLRPPSSPPLI